MSRGDPLARLKDAVYSPNFKATQNAITDVRSKQKAGDRREEDKRSNELRDKRKK
jgi:hypothetical protein